MIPPQASGQLAAQHVVLVAQHQQLGVLGQVRPDQHRQQAEHASHQAVDNRQPHPEMVPATLPLLQQTPARTTKPSFRAGHGSTYATAPLWLAVDAEDSLSISSALGDAVQVLRTADERFADRDGFPFRPRSQAHTTIVGAGHFAQEDRPTEVANLLLNFIEA